MTYHVSSINQRCAAIKGLLNQLDSGWSSEENAADIPALPEMETKLNPERSRTENDSYYSIPASRVFEVLGIKEA